ncbi:MAG: hypothetical protein CMD88_03960 [Gammaproteobacteria bacterium]|nr:hypothetical protein [Gammaproteobacteria bacterium]|tara:strand:- start:161329 stop:162060 length:732 start_codon:yes stop_codon:yes gene_type:complete
MKIDIDITNKHYSNYIKYLMDNDSIDFPSKDVYELNFIKDKVGLKNKNNKSNIFIDFSDKRFSNRVKKINKKNEIFYKIFKKNNSTILDCTAGFGKDSFILSSMGHCVTMIEKNPIVSILLNNALKRFNNTSKFSDDGRLLLFHGDSLDYLYNTDQVFDYAYIDFMFDSSKKTLSSKNLETLKILTEDYNKKKELINLAIHKVRNRVVIKNHIKNDPIYNQKSDYTIYTKLLRYDIYLRKNVR